MPTRGTWIERFRSSFATRMGGAGIAGSVVSATRCVYGGYAVEIRPDRDDDNSLTVFVGEDRTGWIRGADFTFSIDDDPSDAADEVQAFIASRVVR